jgi:rhodanese-related sulfurtransferase
MDINIDELKEKLDNKEEFIFIDVREPHEYEEFNLGAKLVPLGDVMKIVSEYEDQKEQEIVVHCRSGARSGMAKNLLTEAGFINVRNLEGGVLAWQEKY